VSKDESGQMDV